MVEVDQHGGNAGKHGKTSATGSAYSGVVVSAVCVSGHVQGQVSQSVAGVQWRVQLVQLWLMSSPLYRPIEARSLASMISSSGNPQSAV